jgi:hypothetical protein
MATPTKLKSPTITEEVGMTKRDHPPIHPGEVLKEEFLDPMGITAYRLAKSIGVPQVRVDDAEPQ